jgi:hypothetical protein
MDRRVDDINLVTRSPDFRQSGCNRRLIYLKIWTEVDCVICVGGAHKPLNSRLSPADCTKGGGAVSRVFIGADG